jgi:hypothetical protein
MISADSPTAFLRGALRFLMLQSPMRTSIGATGGVFVGVLLDLFRPALKWLDLSAITDFRLMVSGIFIANVSGIFQKDKLPEPIEEQFRITARAITEGKLSPAQAKIYYAQIVTMALEHAKLTASAQQEVDSLDSETITQRPRRPRRSGNSERTVQ